MIIDEKGKWKYTNRILNFSKQEGIRMRYFLGKQDMRTLERARNNVFC